MEGQADKGEVMAKKQSSPFDSDPETARMRLRNLAEDACKVLDARILNLASFHLCAYMDFATGQKGRLAKIMMAEIETEQLNAAAVRKWLAGTAPEKLTALRGVLRA